MRLLLILFSLHANVFDTDTVIELFRWSKCHRTTNSPDEFRLKIKMLNDKEIRILTDDSLQTNNKDFKEIWKKINNKLI